MKVYTDSINSERGVVHILVVNLDLWFFTLKDRVSTSPQTELQSVHRPLL